MIEEPLHQPGAPRIPTTLPYASAPEAGTRHIGPYKLLHQLGEGGMGTVWLAEQLQPVERRVALKIIKPGLDSRQVLARFEAERQALALMDHPNIARVLDAGTTADGLPFFVMELVKGLPITRYCDEHRLSLHQRLELFISACQAVQHAHQKGIIHRDLKPSNILVGHCDGHGVVKIIDFGVAKATINRLSDRTLCTEVGQIVGTLEYMAPEQAQVNNLDIDTRADIYSLGVLLYELLTGHAPLRGRELRSAGLDQIVRLIREEEPRRPSDSLSTSADLDTVAANRSLQPRRLVAKVRGDLDWIVMKCLEKDRTRRYETANGVAADIGRYLADEPVSAGPPTAVYRLRKFLVKHRTAVAVTAAFAVLLIFATLVSLGLAIWANVERKHAETAEAEARDNLRKAVDAADAEAKAKLAADTARKKALEDAAIATTLTEILQIGSEFSIDPLNGGVNGQFIGGIGPRKDFKLSELLDKAVERLDARTDSPRVLAAVRGIIARAYYSVAEYDKAAVQWVMVVSSQERFLGPEDSDTCSSKIYLAGAYTEMKRFADAESLLRPVYETLNARPQSSDAGKALVLRAVDALIVLYRKWDKPQEAARWLEERAKWTGRRD